MSGKNVMNSLLDQPVIAGQDIVAHQNLHSAVFPRALKEKGEGRFLEPSDRGQPNIVISRKIASQHPDAQGNPKKVGDTLHIGGKPFKIVGIYETGSMILDVIIIMDIETARTVLNEPKDSVSCIYVEGDNPADNGALAAAIEKAHPGFDARSMNEAQANFSSLMGQVDTFLLMTVSLALAVGIVGIINTMLMSTTERFVEFGVLRTNGWSQGNILALGHARECLSGFARGLGRLSAGMDRHAGRQPVHLRGDSPGHVSVALGAGYRAVGHDGDPGRLYPAWRAARLMPMDAIRLGSH